MHINMDIQYNWIFIVFPMKFSLNAYDHGVQTWLYLVCDIICLVCVGYKLVKFYLCERLGPDMSWTL